MTAIDTPQASGNAGGSGQMSGDVEVFHDRHVMGLFSRDVWFELMAAADFEPLAVPFGHSSSSDAGQEVFLGRRRLDGEV